MMLEALSGSSLLTSPVGIADLVDSARDGLEDHPDNRSSSLSELGDASDDHSEATPRAYEPLPIDIDSEAETERLETTPRKLSRAATNTSIASEPLYERTPSKLAHSKTLDEVDEDDSAPPTPTAIRNETLILPSVGGEAALNALSVVAEAATIAEMAGKKRKRSSAESSSADEPIDEPARKRSSTVKSATLSGSQEAVAEDMEHIDAEEELDDAEERISQLQQEDLELEERQADVAEAVVEELAIVSKHTKPRKGGRKGKRRIDDPGDSHLEAVASTEPQEGELEGDHDEDDGGALDEEVSKKKNAIDQLAKIEKKFKLFREKLCDEQITQLEQELEMLKQPNCVHPEYLAMVQSIDERRAEKIAYEKQLLRYKQKCLEIRTVAERHQLHSQYFQTVRDVRDDMLSECNQRIHELQRGRRHFGVEEVEYTLNLPEKRSDQIRQQTAYNLEVSILAGVAKYVGFPAAPDITPARATDIEDDLRAMKIAPKPAPAPVPYVRQLHRTSTADEAAAEEQFIERTPWANPQHPVHQQAHYQGVPQGSARAPSQTYHTPAGQRRVVDVHATNGSASTIEVVSNPPSSATAPNGRVGDSESPILQMKRHPSEHTALAETPNSQPRTFTSLTREPYGNNSHMLSNPAAQHPESQLEEPRWGGSGMRPLHAPGAPIPSRPEAVRVPLTQPRNIGAVSVGSGNGLFGR
ncbi:Sds3-like-domain-containing protein [Clohesyomyces aquaticus]|uniref:Sds3-like-domain-containing protein n=1 Tax=Clohesyomyces aquaticus TaxID=1231657 RepID=A0A1Y1ZXR0_9PLEO|nr:Sds3-like-domain-containing protein [Clohesyomyces aquaticus]